MEVREVYEVYADILFLVNFSMDFLCFYLTTKLLHRKPHPVRMVLGAVFGALYAVSAVFVECGRVTAFLADLTVCAFMCALVYAERGARVRSYLVSTGVYFGVSALIGGLMTAFCSLLNRLGLPIDAIGGDGLSAWAFALLAIVCAATAGTVGRFFRRSACERVGQVEITCRGQSVTLSAVTDSGNLLRDPISGRCVVVASVGAVEKLLPPGLPAVLKNGDFTSEAFREACSGLRIRLIPTHTATGESMLLGILPEKMMIRDKNGSRETDALFAPADVRIAGYDALLPPELDA